MKKTFKKSTVLFMALAIFAMIFTGCKKDSASSGGGDTPTPPTPPTPGNYGTVVCGDQQFDIIAGGYTVEFDEELQADYVGIALVDRIDGSEDTKAAVIAIPFYNTVPTGQFEFVQMPEEEGESQLIVTIGDGLVIGKKGSVTISKSGNNYKISANAMVFDYATMTDKSCSINFEGPLVTE